MNKGKFNTIFNKKVAYPALPFPNYGSTLQSFALFRLVQKLGYNCYIINYSRFVNNPAPTKEEIDALGLDEKGSNRSPAQLSPEERKALENKVMRYRFEKFAKRLFIYDDKLQKLETGGERDFSLAKTYDAFICGSDQVWNPSGSWFTPANYLQFAPKGKRISYAASLGQNRVAFRKQMNMPLWRHYLSEMTFLSGREERSSEQLRQISGKEVTTVLDPTLMFSADEWLDAIPSGILPLTLQSYIDKKQPYIVGYLLHGYERYKKAIEEYASQHGYRIAWLTGTDISLEQGFNRVETDPGGFLQLMKHASAICTDSFHGACFSIIFRKPFVSAIIGGMNKSAEVYDIRKYDLFDRLGIPERAVTENQLNVLDIKIDYDSVAQKLSEQQKISLDFLATALETCTKYQPTEQDVPVDIKLVPKPIIPRSINRVPLDDPLNCTGCGACRNICPVDAISMEPDEKGFIVPVVDDEKCIRCGNCLKFCPLRNRPELFRERTPYAYAAWSLDPEIILNSSTGGIFSVLANWTFSKGGIVYGSAMNPDHSLTVHRATCSEELGALRGSKYVQGETQLSFRKVKSDLENGRYVLFSGTSCQIAGLYAFLRNDYAKLITVDLFCAGVASPLVFKKYISMRSEQAKSALTYILFRSKNKGWTSTSLNLFFRNGKKYVSYSDFDPYRFLFLKKFIIRTSCYRCAFKGLENRWADFTIGDFWGLGKEIPFNHPRSQGVSAVCLNSIKARIIFQQLRETPGTIFVEERSVEEMLKGNPILLHKPAKPVVYNKLFESFATKSFSEAFMEWFGPDDIRETRQHIEEFKLKR
ncbi:polysaccharide pyruvyl transferase family protein [Desulfovibrio piger]|nr:polysaccharide pyruvyl transferase family protein [Desulfovibrio piger]